MQIIPYNNYPELLDYLPHLKASPKDWQFVDVRLSKNSDAVFTINQVEDLVFPLFKNKEGRLYICNNHEFLMVVQWGQETPAQQIAENIKDKVPEGSCEIHIHEPTPEGLAKLELLITYKKSTLANSFADKRGTRRENVFMIANDDVYIRRLIKKAAAIPNSTIHEIASGIDVVDAYKKYVPDILFLDIHMPQIDGIQILHDVMALDPKAYVIMLGVDSSAENVDSIAQKGARGLLIAPFDKNKLLGYIQKCPTVSSA